MFLKDFLLFLLGCFFFYFVFEQVEYWNKNSMRQRHPAGALRHLFF